MDVHKFTFVSLAKSIPFAGAQNARVMVLITESNIIHSDLWGPVSFNPSVGIYVNARTWLILIVIQRLWSWWCVTPHFIHSMILQALDDEQVGAVLHVRWSGLPCSNDYMATWWMNPFDVQASSVGSMAIWWMDRFGVSAVGRSHIGYNITAYTFTLVMISATSRRSGKLVVSHGSCDESALFVVATQCRRIVRRHRAAAFAWWRCIFMAHNFCEVCGFQLKPVCSPHLLYCRFSGWLRMSISCVTQDPSLPMVIRIKCCYWCLSTTTNMTEN